MDDSIQNDAAEDRSRSRSPQRSPREGTQENLLDEPVEGGTLRLSKPLPGLLQLTSGRTDFFAELTQVVALEVQRLLRYTMMKFAHPRDIAQEQKAEADAQSALTEIMTHVAEYVDTAIQIVSDNTGNADGEAPPNVEVAILAKQLDQSCHHNQGNLKKMGQQEDRLKRLNMTLKTMRVQFYKDLEGQRDRFRSILNRHLDLPPDELKDVLSELSVVTHFNADDFLDEDTQQAVRDRVEAVEREFQVEREALLSQLQALTEMEVATRHKLKVAMKRGEKLQESLKQLSSKHGAKTLDELPEVPDLEEEEEEEEEESESKVLVDAKISALLVTTKTATDLNDRPSVASKNGGRAEMKDWMDKTLVAEKVRQRVLQEALAAADLLQKQEAWLDGLLAPQISSEVQILKLMVADVRYKTDTIVQEMSNDKPIVPEEAEEFDDKVATKALENDINILQTDKRMHVLQINDLKASNDKTTAENVELEAEVDRLSKLIGSTTKELQSANNTVSGLMEVDAPKIETLKHANTTLKILKMLKWDKGGKKDTESPMAQPDMTSLNIETLDTQISDIVRGEVESEQKKMVMDTEALMGQLRQANAKVTQKSEEIEALDLKLQASEEEGRNNSRLLTESRKSIASSEAKLAALEDQGRERKGSKTGHERKGSKDLVVATGKRKARKGTKKLKPGEQEEDELHTESEHPGMTTDDEAKKKKMRLGGVEEDGPNSKDVSIQTFKVVKTTNAEISATPEVVSEEVQVGKPIGRKRSGPHDFDAILEWNNASGAGGDDSKTKAHEGEIRSLKMKLHNLQAELDEGAKRLAEQVLTPVAHATRASSSRASSSAAPEGGGVPAQAPLSIVSLPPPPRKKLSSQNTVASKVSVDEQIVFDVEDIMDEMQRSPGQKQSLLIKKPEAQPAVDEAKESLTNAQQRMKDLEVDLDVGEAPTSAPADDQGATDEPSAAPVLSHEDAQMKMTREQLSEFDTLKNVVAAQVLAGRGKIARESLRRGAQESGVLAKTKTRTLEDVLTEKLLTGGETKYVKNELRVEYEACLKLKIEEERGRLYRAWPRVSSAEPLVKRKGLHGHKRLSSGVKINSDLYDMSPEVMTARNEALRKIDSARLITYSKEAMMHGASNDARGDDLRELLESDSLFRHYESIGTLVRKLAGYRGEFKRMRNRLAGSLFECDRLRVELFLQKKSQVSQSCEYHILWDRQVFWLSKCVNLLRANGTSASIPEVLLKKKFDDKTVQAVTLFEMNAKGKGYGEAGQIELQSKLQLRRDRMRLPAITEVRRQMLQHQLEAFGMADALFVFHKIEEDEPGTRPKDGMMALKDVGQMAQNAEQMPAAAEQLQKRLRTVRNNAKAFEQRVPTILDLLNKLEVREHETLDHYKDSLLIETGDHPPRRELEETVQKALKANRELDDSEYFCSEAEIEAARGAPAPDSSDDEFVNKQEDNEEDIRANVADTVAASLARQEKRWQTEHDDDADAEIPGMGSEARNFAKRNALKSVMRNNFSGKSKGTFQSKLKSVVELAKAKKALEHCNTVKKEVEDAMQEPSLREKRAAAAAKRLEDMDPATAAESLLKLATEERGLAMDAMVNHKRTLLLSALPAVILRLPTMKKKEISKNYEQMMGKPLPETEEEAAQHAAEAEEEAASRQISSRMESANSVVRKSMSQRSKLEDADTKRLLAHAAETTSRPPPQHPEVPSGSDASPRGSPSSRSAAAEAAPAPRAAQKLDSSAPVQAGVTEQEPTGAPPTQQSVLSRRRNSVAAQAKSQEAIARAPIDKPRERIVKRTVPASVPHGLWETGEPINEKGASFGFFSNLMAGSHELPTVPTPSIPEECPHPDRPIIGGKPVKKARRVTRKSKASVSDSNSDLDDDDNDDDDDYAASNSSRENSNRQRVKAKYFVKNGTEDSTSDDDQGSEAESAESAESGREEGERSDKVPDGDNDGKRLPDEGNRAVKGRKVNRTATKYQKWAKHQKKIATRNKSEGAEVGGQEEDEGEGADQDSEEVSGSECEDFDSTEERPHPTKKTSQIKKPAKKQRAPKAKKPHISDHNDDENDDDWVDSEDPSSEASEVLEPSPKKGQRKQKTKARRKVEREADISDIDVTDDEHEGSMKSLPDDSPSKRKKNTGRKARRESDSSRRSRNDEGDPEFKAKPKKKQNRTARSEVESQGDDNSDDGALPAEKSTAEKKRRTVRKGKSEVDSEDEEAKKDVSQKGRSRAKSEKGGRHVAPESSPESGADKPTRRCKQTKQAKPQTTRSDDDDDDSDEDLRSQQAMHRRQKRAKNRGLVEADSPDGLLDPASASPTRGSRGKQKGKQRADDRSPSSSPARAASQKRSVETRKRRSKKKGLNDMLGEAESSEEDDNTRVLQHGRGKDRKRRVQKHFSGDRVERTDSHQELQRGPRRQRTSDSDDQGEMEHEASRGDDRGMLRSERHGTLHSEGQPAQCPHCHVTLHSVALPRAPQIVTPAGSMDPLGNKSSLLKVIPKRKVAAAPTNISTVSQPQHEVETETRETQTDMPLSSNMKVGITQTDDADVERFAATRQMVQRRSVAKKGASGELVVQGSAMGVSLFALANILKLQKKQKVKSRGKRIQELSQRTFRRARTLDEEVDGSGDEQVETNGADDVPKPQRQPHRLHSQSSQMRGGLVPARKARKKRTGRRKIASPTGSSAEAPDSPPEEENIGDEQEDADSPVIPENAPLRKLLSFTDIEDDIDIVSEAGDEVTEQEESSATADDSMAEIDSGFVKDVEAGDGVTKQEVADDDTDVLIAAAARLGLSIEDLTEEELDALRDTDAPVEVVDVIQQCDIKWHLIPGAIISWLKKNLMERMQSEFYCLPWKASELEWFPELQRPDRLIKDFEEFITTIMGRIQPSKHEVRSCLRKKYRDAVKPKPDMEPEVERGRRRSMASPSGRQARSESPVVSEASRLAPFNVASCPPHLDSPRDLTVINAPYEYPAFSLKPAVDGQKQASTAEPAIRQKQAHTNLKPLGWGPNFPATRYLHEIECLPTDIASAQLNSSQPEVHLEEVLGFVLPQSVFNGSTDQDPYQMNVAAREGVKAAGPESTIAVNEDPPEGDKSGDIDGAVATFLTEASKAEIGDSSLVQIPLTQEARDQRVRGLVTAVANTLTRFEQNAFDRMNMSGTILPVKLQVGAESTRGVSNKPLAEKANPWRGETGKKKANLVPQRPVIPPEEYVGAVSWSYRKPVPQPFAEPEPEEAPIVMAPPRKERWTQQRAEDMIRVLADPRDHVANLITHHGRRQYGFQPEMRSHLTAIGAKPEDPLKPASPPASSGARGKAPQPPQPPPSRFPLGPGLMPTTPRALRLENWTPTGELEMHSKCIERPQLMALENWTEVREKLEEVALPKIGPSPPASPPKNAKRPPSSLKTPRDGPRLGGTG